MIEAREPILVLAPTGRDSFLISDTLRPLRLSIDVCSDLDEFALHLEQGAAAGLIVQEALHEGAPTLARALREQPPWSDIPLILMTTHKAPDRVVFNLLEQGANITLLERPLRVQTLTAAVASAVRQRNRQYELRDRVTESQRTEERLRQTQKLESLGVLAGGVAHDFNNLLTGIMGGISLALDREPPSSPRRRYLEDAIQASERAADLTRQLLAYAGKGRFIIQPVNLSDLVREINRLIEISIPKNVRVVLNLSGALPPIEGDPAQLQQIVMNLLMNAAEAIASNQVGLVVAETGMAQVDENYLRKTLRAENAAPGEYVYIEVRDTGCGIDEATLSRIFDPFFTTKFMGRGLGLAAALGIVRGHGGALKVDSVRGQGSTFRVLLPAKGVSQQKRTIEFPVVERSSGNQTILVVDDEEIVRKAARNSLESWGYRVLLAENGQIAVDLFTEARDRISLVLLDMTMPVMNGEEKLLHLQRIEPGVKVILTSGYDESEAMVRFQGAGLAGFIQKPYTASRLVERVNRIFESGSAPGA